MGHQSRLPARHGCRHGHGLGRRQGSAKPQPVGWGGGRAWAGGGDRQSRKVGGGGVGIAKILAATAARHTIMASETAYERLASHFLLRPRGVYFLPETGDMRTFIVIGRL